MERGDYIKAHAGHFKGQRGQVMRVSEEMACVVWKDGWEHGIWVFLYDITKVRSGTV